MEKDVYYDLCVVMKYPFSENCRNMMKAVCPDETEARILWVYRDQHTPSEVAEIMNMDLEAIKEATMALRRKGALGYTGLQKDGERIYRLGEYGLATVEDFTDGISEAIAALYYDYEKDELKDPSKQLILDTRLKFLHEDWYRWQRPDEVIHGRQIYQIGFKPWLQPAVDALEKSGLVGENLPEEYHKYSLREAALKSPEIFQAICPCRFGEGVTKGPRWTCTRMTATTNPVMMESSREEVELGIRQSVDYDTWHERIIEGERDGGLHIEGACLCNPNTCNILKPLFEAGATIQEIIEEAPPFRSIPNPDAKECVKCHACVEKCRFGAIKIVDGVPQSDETKCYGCGTCVAVCPQERYRLKLIPIDKK